MRRVRRGPKRPFSGQLALKPHPRSTIAPFPRAAACFLNGAVRTSARLAAVIVIACWAHSSILGQQLKLTPYSASGIYDVGEKAGWKISAADDTSAPSAGFAYAIKKNNLNVIKSGNFDLSSSTAN